MTRVDFYLLTANEPGAAALAACRIAAKAHHLGHRIYIRTHDDDQARQLDQLLWTFSAGSFVPHELNSAERDDVTPVVIGVDAPPAEFDDVLINLGDDVPDCFSRFMRVAEVVGGEEAARARARERFRFYRDRGYALETHNL